MKTYVVAYCNAYDGIMSMEKITAENEMAAIAKHTTLIDYDFTGDDTIEEIKQHVQDCDGNVGILEI